MYRIKSMALWDTVALNLVYEHPNFRENLLHPSSDGTDQKLAQIWNNYGSSCIVPTEQLLPQQQIATFHSRL
jgi:hypothetical protein